LGAMGCHGLYLDKCALAPHLVIVRGMNQGSFNRGTWSYVPAGCVSVFDLCQLNSVCFGIRLLRSALGIRTEDVDAPAIERIDVFRLDLGRAVEIVFGA